MAHDLQTELFEKMESLERTVLSLHALGTDSARKEKEYRMTWREFEKTHTREEFRNRYGMSYAEV